MKLNKIIRVVVLVGSFTLLAFAASIVSRPAAATQQMESIYLPMLTNLDKDLVHYWSFNEGSGNAIYDSRQGNRAGIAGPLNWTVGPDNTTAFAFDGDENHIRLDIPNIEPPWTASFWVKRMGTARGMALLGSQTHYIKLEAWPNIGKVGLTEWFVTNKNFDYTAPRDTWVHLTLVSTGSELLLYEHGMYIGAISYDMPLPLEVIGNNGTEWNEGMIAALDDFGYGMLLFQLMTF